MSEDNKFYEFDPTSIVESKSNENEINLIDKLVSQSMSSDDILKDISKDEMQKDKSIKTRNENLQSLIPQNNANVIEVIQDKCSIYNLHNNPYNDSLSQLKSYIADAGLSYSQKQNINYMIAKGMVINDAYSHKKFTDLMIMQTIMKMKNMNKDNLISPNGIVLANNGTDMYVRKTTNAEELISMLFQKYFIIKKKNLATKNGVEYWILMENIARFIPLTEEELKNLWLECVFENTPMDTEIPQNNINQWFKKLKLKIPFLENSGLRTISEHEVVLLDGIYNTLTDEFSETTVKDARIFNTYSIPYNFISEMDSPEAYEAVLDDITGEDETKKTLIYQSNGLILSASPHIKKIQSNQGCSNGGKTFLSTTLASLMYEDDVKFVDKISDITQDSLNKELKNKRLIIIDEVANKKMSPIQVSMLKTIANGNNTIKILMNTNNRIYTNNDGSIEKALANRILTIPYEKQMDFVDERIIAFKEVHLGREKSAIIRKSLESYHEVVVNKKFAKEYPINYFIEEDISADPDDQLEELDNQRVQSAVQKAKEAMKNVSNNLVSELFKKSLEITEEVQPLMTTEAIMSFVNEATNSKFDNPNSFGKNYVRMYYKEQLKSDRNSDGKTCYNLRFRDDSDEKINETQDTENQETHIDNAQN